MFMFFYCYNFFSTFFLLLSTSENISCNCVVIGVNIQSTRLLILFFFLFMEHVFFFHVSDSSVDQCEHYICKQLSTS